MSDKIGQEIIMPSYDYLCDSCHTEFETHQSVKDPVGADCTNCGNYTTHRLISSTSFVLKGSVWAKDGYHSKLREEIKKLPTVPESDDD